MPMLGWFKLHYWPVFTSVWFVLAFLISYLISVLNKHVYPLFPYISDTGTTSPESCIFGQMLNIGAVFMIITMYIRHRQVEFAMTSKDIGLKKIWLYLGFWSGAVACIGVSMVGNFQETNVISVHLVGAFMAFLSGALYLLVQTRISFSFRHINYTCPKYGVGRNMVFLRLFLTVMYFIFVFGVIIFSAIALNVFTGDDIKWWTSDHDGYAIHLVATFSEWLLGFTLMAYLFTLTNEFKSIEFEEIRFKDKRVKIANDNNVT